MNSREMLERVASWLGWQNEDLCAGLRSPFDALRLWDYAQARPDLPEMADEWEACRIVQVIGYNPYIKYVEPETTGCLEIADLLKESFFLLDSVAFIKEEGDTHHVKQRIEKVIEL